MDYLLLILKEHRHWNFHPIAIFMKLLSNYVKSSFFSCGRKRFHQHFCNKLLEKFPKNKLDSISIHILLDNLNQYAKFNNLGNDKEFIDLLSAFFSIYEAYFPYLDPTLQQLLTPEVQQKKLLSLSEFLEDQIKCLWHFSNNHSHNNAPLMIDTVSGLKNYLHHLSQEQKEQSIESMITILSKYNFVFQWGYELEKFHQACETLQQLIATSSKKEKYVKQLLCYFSLSKKFNLIETTKISQDLSYKSLSTIIAHCYPLLTQEQKNNFSTSFFADETLCITATQALVTHLTGEELYTLLIRHNNLDCQSTENILALLISKDKQNPKFQKLILDTYHCKDIELSQRAYLALSLIFDDLKPNTKTEMLGRFIDWLKNASKRYEYFDYYDNYAETVACICKSLLNCIPHLPSDNIEELVSHLLPFYIKYPQKAPDLQLSVINLALKHWENTAKKTQLIHRFVGDFINCMQDNHRSYADFKMMIFLIARSFELISNDQQRELQKEYFRIEKKHTDSPILIQNATALTHILPFLPSWTEKVEAFITITKVFSMKDFVDIKPIESQHQKFMNEAVHDFMKALIALPELISYEECLVFQTHLIDAFHNVNRLSKKEQNFANNMYQGKVQLFSSVINAFQEATKTKVVKSLLNQVFDEKNLSDIVMSY